MNPALSLPSAPVPELRQAPPLNWAILGPGYIAAQFAQSLKQTQHRVAAVASRDLGRSTKFAQTYGDSNTQAFGQYGQLLQQAEFDIAYIAVPHSAHYELARQAIEAGKHVLVEKPFTLNATQSATLAELARSAGVFAMEGVWSRCIPSGRVIRELLGKGTLGRITSFAASLGDHFPHSPTSRIHDPALGGGALLDLGIYPLALSALIAEPRELLHASGQLSPSGVDNYSTVVLANADGSLSTLHSSIKTRLPNNGWLVGEHGILEVCAPLYAPSKLILRQLDGTVADEQEFAETSPVPGLAWEAAHVAECLAEQKLESELMPLAQTVHIAQLLDQAAARLREAARTS